MLVTIIAPDDDTYRSLRALLDERGYVYLFSDNKRRVIVRHQLDPVLHRQVCASGCRIE